MSAALLDEHDQAPERFPAHELVQTVNCKTPECPHEANPGNRRGLLAGLCDDCANVKRDQASARARAQHGRLPLSPQERQDGAARPAPAPAPLPAPARERASLKAAAQALVPVAADLDKALLRKRHARADAEAAFAAFKTAFEEIQRIAREAVA